MSGTTLNEWYHIVHICILQQNTSATSSAFANMPQHMNAQVIRHNANNMNALLMLHMVTHMNESCHIARTCSRIRLLKRTSACRAYECMSHTP